MIKFDVKTTKRNLVWWACQAREELNKDPQEIKRMWEATKLTKAWDKATMMEAARRAEELFGDATAVKTKVVKSSAATADVEEEEPVPQAPAHIYIYVRYIYTHTHMHMRIISPRGYLSRIAIYIYI